MKTQERVAVLGGLAVMAFSNAVLFTHTVYQPAIAAGSGALTLGFAAAAVWQARKLSRLQSEADLTLS